MAQDFERHIDRVTGTSPVTVFTSDSDDTVIGIRCANVVGSAINVDVYIVNSAVNYYLVKTAPIPVGGSLELIDGGANTCQQVEAITLHHIGNIHQKILDLKKLEKILAKISSQCEGGVVPECPILDALFEQNK